MPVDAQTQLNFVIGSPIRHSRSPALHEALYANLGINAVMVAIDPPDLKTLAKSIKHLDVRLTAVTLPFKTDILSHVDDCSPEVQALGAANTLVQRDGLIKAHNTDVAGIRAALQGVSLENKTILILGAGGAARAVVYALRNHLIYIANRGRERAHALSESLPVNLIDYDDIQSISPDIIINATPVGMFPHVNDTPLPHYAFHSNQTVFDLVYTPEQTRLMREAKAAGATVIGGEVMFIEQAKKQIELAYGVCA